jgi:gliding motility-associated-like protein
MKYVLLFSLSVLFFSAKAQQWSPFSADNFDVSTGNWQVYGAGNTSNFLEVANTIYSINENSLQVVNNSIIDPIFNYSPGYTFGNSENTPIKYRYFSTSNQYNVKIMFDWKCNGEQDQDYGTMYYSTDAINWILLKNYQSGKGNDIQTESYTLPKCIQNSSFYLGFSFHSDNSFNFQPGLVIDNIQLFGSFCNAGNTPGTPINPSNMTVCYNDVQTVTLSAFSSSGNFRWYKSTACEEYFHQGVNYKTLPLETTVYYVSALNSNGCESNNRIPIYLNVRALPTMTNSSVVNAVYGSDASIVTSISGTPPLTYNWNLEANSNFTSTSQNLTNIDQGNYTLTVTDGNLCQDSFKIIVLTGAELDIPQGISPNGDGYNDSWVITGIQQWTDFSVELRNMRGELVYMQNSTDNPIYIPMEGIDVNGDLLPPGDYSFLIRSKSRKKNYSGILSIKYD